MPSRLEITPDLITQIADLVVDALNAGEFSQTFEAKRYANRTHALKDTGPLRVAVMRGAIRETKATRRSVDHEFDIAVAVIQKIPEPAAGVSIEDTEQELSDALLVFAQELAKSLRETPLANLADGERAIHAQNEIHNPYNPDQFEKLRLFVCPLTATYKVLG